MSSLDAVSKATRILDAIDNHAAFWFRELREGVSNDDRIPRTVLKIRREIDMIDLRNVESVGNAIYIICDIFSNGRSKNIIYFGKSLLSQCLTRFKSVHH